MTGSNLKSFLGAQCWQRCGARVTVGESECGANEEEVEEGGREGTLAPHENNF